MMGAAKCGAIVEERSEPPVRQVGAGTERGDRDCDGC